MVESVMARLRLMRVPQLLIGTTLLSGFALVLCCVERARRKREPMTDLSNFFLLLVILHQFLHPGQLAGSTACIRAVALQGVVLALLPLAVHGFTGHALLLAVGALTLKGGAASPGCCCGRSASARSAARWSR